MKRGVMTTLAMQERFFTLPDCFSDTTVSELVSGKWIQAMPYSSFDHPLYGEVEITPEIASIFTRNFDERVYKQDIPISYEHFGMDASKGLKAAGWVKAVEARDDGFWWQVAFTDEAAQEIADGAWRYFSPEFFDVWKDPESNMFHSYVIGGGALTNSPFFKGMVPLNFSSLLIAEHDDTKGAGTKGSVADIEHGEPGSGEPRTDDAEPDSQDGQGTRGPSPVIEPEDSMEEFLKNMREKLGLPADADEAAILVAASDLVGEVTPLREAALVANEKQTFADRFPQEFSRMQKLEEADRVNKAKAFADRYAAKRLVEGTGDEATPTGLGFSALTIENIEKMHLAFSEGALKQEHVEAVLESLLNTGLVDYNELGTKVTDDDVVNATPLAFAEKVASIQAEDKIDYSNAVRVAAARHPELFKAYRESVSTRS